MAHVAVRIRRDGTKSYRVKWRDPVGGFRERTFARKKDAEDYAKALDTDKGRGVLRDERKARMTFGAVAEEWLPTKVRKTRTNREYRRILESRILPTFRNWEVGSITVTDCVALRDALIRDGLRPTTVTKVYGLFAVVLAYAVSRHYIVSSPAQAVGLPDNNSAEVAEFEARYLTPAELEALISAASWFHPTYGLIVRLLGTSGMRVGELAGLNIGRAQHR